MSAEEFEVGVVDSRTLEEKLTAINASLDLYEVVTTMEYVLKKYDDSSDDPITPEEMTEEELDSGDLAFASVDVTLNLNNDHFRFIRVDRRNTFKYTIMTQINFDNIVHSEEYTELQPELDALAEKIKALGTGDTKTKAESKYLVGGARD